MYFYNCCMPCEKKPAAHFSTFGFRLRSLPILKTKRAKISPALGTITIRDDFILKNEMI